MEESTKKKMHQIEIGVAVLLLLVSIASFFPNPGITGFVSVDTKKQEMNLEIANSQNYIMTTKNEKPFALTSFKISGEVVGNGIVKVYLDNGQGQKILVYTNAIKENGGLSRITGMDKITGRVIGPDSEAESGSNYLLIDFLENTEGDFSRNNENQEMSSGKFLDSCIDSCFIEMMMGKDIAYQLSFHVEEGTVLYLNEIVFSIRED